MKPANYITNEKEEDACPICGHPGVTEETCGFKYRHTVKEPLTGQPSPGETHPQIIKGGDNTSTSWKSPDAVVLDVYQDGSIILLVETGEKTTVFELCDGTLESQRDQARKEITLLQEDLQRAYEDRNRARMKEEQKWRPQLDDQRAKMRKMHRRAQNAEGQTCQFRRLFDKWKNVAEFWHREFLRHHGPVELKIAQSKIAELEAKYKRRGETVIACLDTLNAANADNARLREALAEFLQAAKIQGTYGLMHDAERQAQEALSTPPPNQTAP